MDERIYYAVGDIHGEYERLVELHDTINMHWRDEGGGRPATLLHLGDYIDRGPDSRRVVDYLIDLQKTFAGDEDGFEVVCLMGNHERMMLDALKDAEPGALAHWLKNGGEQTVESYVRDAPPETPRLDAPSRAHLEWMSGLPIQTVIRTAGLLFVHAGVQPDRYPNCDEAVYLWTRSPSFMDDSSWPWNPELDPYTVVHGHTPTEDGEPYVGQRRINLDTGACYGGKLTAAIFMPGEKVSFLTT